MPAPRELGCQRRRLAGVPHKASQRRRVVDHPAAISTTIMAAVIHITRRVLRSPAMFPVSKT